MSKKTSPFRGSYVNFSFMNFTDLNQIRDYAKTAGLMRFYAWQEPNGLCVGRGTKMLKTFKKFVHRALELLPASLPDELTWGQVNDEESDETVWKASNNAGGLFVVHADSGGPICLELGPDGDVLHMHLSATSIDNAKEYAQEIYAARLARGKI